MQKFGNDSNLVKSSYRWLLQDINISIWNGTCFLKILSEDFSGKESDIKKKYDIRLGKKKFKSGNIPRLLFTGKVNDLEYICRSIVINLTDTSGSCEARGEKKLLFTFSFLDVSFKGVIVVDGGRTVRNGEKIEIVQC